MTILENKVPQRAEYGTPPGICNAIHALMGGIDLDPCSSPWFNTNVRSAYIYTEEMNGIDQPWLARVYLNPPGGRSKIKTKAWWRKLVQEYESGNVTQAAYMSFALDSFQWSQGAGTFVGDYPTIMFEKRIKFFEHPKADGKPDFNAQPVESKSPNRPCALHWLPPKGEFPIREAFKIFRDVLADAGYPGRIVQAW